jgi:uncharacterized protein (TIRG00374 family)
MRKIFLFFLSLVIGLVIFSFITTKVGTEEIVKAFSLFSWWGLVLVLIVTILIAFVSILRSKFILNVYGKDLSFLKTTELWMAGFAVSFLTPIAVLGGEFLIIYVLKKVYGLPWKKSIAATFVNKVMDASAFFPFLVLGLIVFPTLSDYFPSGNMIFFGSGITIFFVFLLVIFYIKSFKKESILDSVLKFLGSSKKKVEKKRGGRIIVNAEQEILTFFGLRKKSMWIGLSLSFFKYFLMLIRCWLLIFFFQGGTSILRALSVYGFFNLSSLVPVPAMLGSLEIIQGLVFEGMGLGANIGIAFALLIRSVDLLLVFAGLIFLIKIAMDLTRMKITGFVGNIMSFKKSSFFEE